MDRKQFREWLASKDPNHFVGRRCTSVGCPLALFAGRRVDPVARPEDYPKWVVEFVDSIDGELGKNERVIAAEALAVLDAIP